MGKRRGEIWKWILSSCLLLVLLTVAFLPTFLFSRVGLDFILPRLNQVISGELTITSCAGGWTKGLACDEVQFRRSDGQSLFMAQQVAVDRSLLRLLMAPRNVGEIFIDSPVIRVPVAAKTSAAKSESGSAQTESPVEIDPSSAETKSNIENESAGPGKEKPFWEGLIAGLRVRKGRVITPMVAPGLQTLAEEINFQARLNDGTVNYAFQMLSGEQQGRVFAKGFFNLPIYNQPLLPALVSSTEVEITRLDLTGFLRAFAAAQPAGGPVPTGQGMLNGKWQVKTAGFNNIVVQGSSTINDFALTGGILGADRPEFKQLELVIDGARKSEKEWAVNTFLLYSELLSLKSSGTLHDNNGEVKASGKLQLPALFTMFPHTLKMKDDVTVTEGELDFDLALQKSKGVNRVVANAGSSVLQGAFKQQHILWDDPFSLSVDVYQEEGGGSLFFSKLQLVTDFLALEGNGSLDNFSLHGTADLEKASKAMNTFVETEYQVRGQAEFDSSSMILQDQQYQVTTTLNVKKFAMDDTRGNFVPEHPLQLSVKGTAPRSWLDGKGSMDLDFSTDSWLGEGQAQLFDMKRDAGRSSSGWLNGGYAVNGSLDLEPLTTFLNRIRPDKEQIFAKGVASVKASGKTEPQLLKIGKFDFEISNLEMQYRDIGYEDQHVRFALLGKTPDSPIGFVNVAPLVVLNDWKDYGSVEKGWATFDLTHREMVLPHLFFDSGILSVPSASMQVADWQFLTRDFTLDFTSEFAVDNLVEVIHQMDQLPGAVKGKGSAVVSGHVFGRDKQLEALLQIQGQDLAYLRDKKIIVDKQDLNAKIELHHAVGTKDAVLPEISVQSQLLTWDGKADFRGGDAANITIEGEVIPDFTFLATLLESVTGKQFKLTGRNAQTISASLALSKSGEKGNPFTFHYQGGIDAIQYQGIDISKFTLSSAIEKGKGIFTAAGNLNKGTLSFSPLYDGTGDTAALSLQKPEEILSAVHLQEPLVKNVLAKMHPLFGVLVRPQGVISMRADSLFVPLGEAEKTRFRTIIDVQQVQLESNVFLREILQLVNVSGDSLDLKDAEITCQGENGRVSCSPVHILAAEAEMTLHGSAGYDGSLDYLLTIPVTKALVGKEGYRILEGTTIDIPIKGSVDEPLFSRDNLQQTIAEIIKQAAAGAVEKQIQKVIPGLLENIFGN
ncbi:hypothetical protein [Desulfogranum marinum]|uniref:hypothetical protein n=1 Tax=Desulfogranum marinum TaxID=453220 RepID=UPI001963A24D|nr:hypothetical protein [Desulfogranum marinum]MBM9510907.1 hypothetical protein [Desulfogranum marinum]